MKVKFVKRGLTILMLVLIYVDLGFAIINVEGLRKQPYQAGRSGSFETNLKDVGGNTNTFEFSGLIRFHYQLIYPQRKPSDASLESRDPMFAEPPFVKRRLTFQTGASYSEDTGTKNANNSHAYLRFIEMATPHWGIDSVFQLQANEFQRLTLRRLVGVGYRWEAVHLKEWTLSQGLLGLLEHNIISEVEGTVERTNFWITRMSLNISSRIDLFNSGSTMQYTFIYQPNVIDFEDYRMLHELEIAIAAVDNFSFGLTLNYNLDSRPPTGVKGFDRTLTNNIRYSF